MTSGSSQSVAAFQRSTSSVRESQPRSTSVFTSHRVVPHQWHSDWVNELKDRLDELTALPVGWDGYVGRPVSFQCAAFVASMLDRLCRDDVPAPYLVPGSDGTLQVEWHRNNFDVELDVLGVQNVEAIRVNHLTGEEEFLEVQNDFSEIVNWVSALADDGDLVDS